MTPQAIVVPLGRAAESAVGLLIDEGLVDEGRCLFRLPHPSGAKGSRVREYAARRSDLTEDVERLFGKA